MNTAIKEAMVPEAYFACPIGYTSAIRDKYNKIF